MLPIFKDNSSSDKMIIYGLRDVTEIINSCSNLKDVGLSPKEVNKALHNDIFAVEDTIQYLIEQLNIWFEINK